MLLEGAKQEAVPEPLGLLKGHAPRVQKRRQGRNEGEESLCPAKALEQVAAIGNRLHDGIIVLLGQPGHEEEVDPPRAILNGRVEERLQLLIGVRAAKGL